MAPRSSTKNPPQRRTCLYVDDDPGAISVAQEVAAQRKLVLMVAPDLGQALNLARRRRPEVILVNLDLAALAAATVIQILRANPISQAAPVLALANDAAPRAAIKALEAGFFLYLAKPLEAERFTEALDYALEFSALERAEL